MIRVLILVSYVHGVAFRWYAMSFLFLLVRLLFEGILLQTVPSEKPPVLFSNVTKYETATEISAQEIRDTF